MLIEHWVPKLPLHTLASRADSTDTTRDNAHQKPDVDAIRKDFLQYRSARTQTRAGRARRWSAEIALLHALQRNGVAYAPFTTAIFAILMRDSGAPTLFYRFRELQRHPWISVPPELPPRLFQHFLRSKSNAGFAFALRVFKTSPTLSLQEAPALLMCCARADKLDTSAFWRIVHRQTGGLTCKHLHTAPSERVSKEYAELMEFAALEIAKSPAAAPRVAFRRVWEIYAFLRRHKIAITPVLTKALVVAGVLRYLEEYRRPATSQVTYILRLVERVEGTEAAEKIDQAVSLLWNKQVLPVVKQRWREMMARARDNVRSVLEESERQRSKKYKEGLYIGPRHRRREVRKMVRKRRLLATHKILQDATSMIAVSSLGSVQVDSSERAEVATCDKSTSTTGYSPLGVVKVDAPERAELQHLVPPCDKHPAIPTASDPASPTFEEPVGTGIETFPIAPFSTRENTLGYSTPSLTKLAKGQNASTSMFPAKLSHNYQLRSNAPPQTVQTSTTHRNSPPQPPAPIATLSNRKKLLGYSAYSPFNPVKEQNLTTSPTELRENDQLLSNTRPQNVQTSTTHQEPPSLQPPPPPPPPAAIVIDEAYLRREASQKNNVAICPTTRNVFILAPSARPDSTSGGEGGELIEIDVAYERVRQEAENAKLEGRAPTQEERDFKTLVWRGVRKTARWKAARFAHKLQGAYRLDQCASSN
ncbi:hypothetical protein BST61_g2624 [Cercospora zeina]